MLKMCKYYIIDKDKATVNSIRRTMEDFQDFDYIGFSQDNDIAMNTLLKETPTVVFINIDNTLKNTFQFVSDINLYSSDEVHFIGISRQKEKAFELLKLGFYDLLINPLTDLEIRKTLLSFQKKKLVKKKKKRLCLKYYNDIQYVEIDNILYLKADNNSTEFYMSDSTTINAYKTLKYFENQLPKYFSRIHKSYIINRNFVTRIQFSKSSCYIRKIECTIPFTKTYFKTIENMSQNLAQLSNTSHLN
jgi:DNA-binding LytR/AlgR family response regulator